MTVKRPLRVFFCHASQDKPAVRELHKRLIAEGWIDPWLDEEKISLGQLWTNVIEDALDSSDVVIIFLSKNSVQKEGFVQRELQYAWELSLQKPQNVIFLIPFRLDECDVPKHLRFRQWGDYFGENKELTYQNLIRALRQRHQQKIQLEADQSNNLDTIRKQNFVNEPDKKAVTLSPQGTKAEAFNEIPKNKDATTVEITTFEPKVDWHLPVVEDILEKGQRSYINEQIIQDRARLIQETLASLGAPVQVVEINYGPSITQFGVEPLYVKTRGGRTKVRASMIESLAGDLAVHLGKRNIRIQVPVPGRNFVGIEVPNDNMTPIALRDITESNIFQKNTSPLKFVLGRDVAGRPTIATLEDSSHLLISGSSHSGKSVFLNSLLACLLLYNTPNELRLILIDPLRVELGIYNGIPHLVTPVVVEVERAFSAFQWVTREMDKRYTMFTQIGVRNIIEYNAQKTAKNDEELPYLLVVISEFGELIKALPRETEQIITRLGQLSKSTGIYLILVTQHPSVDVLTRQIKINFSTRIAFVVKSSSESRVIIDQVGAEQLLGRGDMLFQTPIALTPLRLQGPFISNDEIQKLLEFWSNQYEGLNTILEKTSIVSVEPAADPLLLDAIELVRREGRASVSMLQRHMSIGYTRAARIVDVMEAKGIIGPPEGTSRIRKILDFGPDSSQKTV
jgi:DNA segregation ATPase FtsK/SpoIIIE, S-DNA-T family